MCNRTESLPSASAKVKLFEPLPAEMKDLKFNNIGQIRQTLSGFSELGFCRRVTYQKNIRTQPKTSDLERKSFGIIVKTAYYVSGGTFFKQFFFRNSKKKLGLRVENLRLLSEKHFSRAAETAFELSRKFCLEYQLIEKM